MIMRNYIDIVKENVGSSKPEAILSMMTEMYTDWLEKENLPHISADELFYHDDIKDYQRRWLTLFTQAWDALESMTF